MRAAVFDRISLTEPELRPLVIEPAMVPIIRDLTLAIAHYPLAVLAAVFHATGPDAVLCATLAIRALLAVAPEDYGRYIQMISELVGDDVMQQVREQLPPQDEAELSEIERRGSAFTRGRREGIEQGFHLGLEQGIGQGLEQGLERGLEQGIERGIEQMQTTLRNILAARGLATPPQILARIAACESIDELSSMLVRATTIDSADQLFSD